MGKPKYRKPKYDVKSRPAWERNIIRDCIGQLVSLCERYGATPDKAGVSDYLDEWRQKGGVA
jgi:hypothetical protein